MFDGRWRHAVDRTTKPVGTVLVRAGITADVLTVFGLVMSVVTALAVGSGHLVLGIVLLFPTGLPDLFDGPVAKAVGTGVGAGRLLRLGGRPRLRRLPLRRRGVVPGRPPPRPDGPAALRHPGRDLAHLLPAGQGRAARAVGQGRPHGAGRAVHPARASASSPGPSRPSAFVPALWVFFGLITATAIGRFVRVWKEAEGPPPRVPARVAFADGRRGRHPAGAGPLARGPGRLPLADLARGPGPARRHRRARRRSPRRADQPLGSVAGPARRRAVEPLGSHLAGPARRRGPRLAAGRASGPAPAAL